MTRALILGIGGQDGSYLADLLLAKGYEVHGAYRRSSVDNLARLSTVRDRLHLHRFDLADPLSVVRVVGAVKPDELYNMADQDHIGTSHDTGGYSVQVTAGGVASVLEAIRIHAPDCRVIQPVSATIFGDAPAPQSEDTPINPLSPYACAKAHALYLCRMYRRVHGVRVSCPILFNHDSPRRGDEYLLHYLCRGAVRIAAGKQRNVELGILSQLVDIGYAPEYVEAMWRLNQLDERTDVCVGTGSGWALGLMAEHAFKVTGLSWEKFVVYKPLPDGAQPDMVCSPMRLESLIGKRPEQRVWNVIDTLIDHYRAREGTA